MKTPKLIRFRCYCLECGNDDKPKDNALQHAMAGSEPGDVRENEPNPLLIADSVEKLLFGA